MEPLNRLLQSVYNFFTISYSLLSLTLNVYLIILEDLLGFLRLMFAKHPVASPSIDNSRAAAESLGSALCPRAVPQDGAAPATRLRPRAPGIVHQERN